MKIFSKFTKKQYFLLFITFIVFSTLILYSEYRHEKSYRIYTLNKELNGYTDLINHFILKHTSEIEPQINVLDSLPDLLPNKNLRITIINLNGKVIFDSQVSKPKTMQNHLKRPEIQESLNNNFGTDIRISATTKVKYYYFAKHFPKYFIRVSDVYNIDAEQIIEPDKISSIFILFLLFISSISLILITDKFGKSITTLKQFTIQASADKPIDESLSFPENELGIIGQDIVAIYRNLVNTKKELVSEKEKLIRHLNISEEGIAIFTKNKKLITNNSHFIHYINQISTKLVYLDHNFFNLEDLKPVFNFVDKYISQNNNNPSDEPSYEISVQKNNKIFSIKCIIFHDDSFEILINDITKPAKRKLLKQQLTDNIAHELKTPVSSIRGFLEILVNRKIETQKQNEFIRKAYAQSCRLTDLIEDISLLTKIEESSGFYKIEKINLYQIISDVVDDLHLKIIEHTVSINVKIPETLELNANATLLYSVFRNLLDNTIAYAGNNLTVTVEKYTEDAQFCYFSFSDNGIGVPEQDLSRLFERFYRVDKGRDRKSGGTGLGLAIVKNAVLFHKGEISIKNRNEGGLEFLFSLNKNLETISDSAKSI